MLGTGANLTLSGLHGNKAEGGTRLSPESHCDVIVRFNAAPDGHRGPRRLWNLLPAPGTSRWYWGKLRCQAHLLESKPSERRGAYFRVNTCTASDASTALVYSEVNPTKLSLLAAPLPHPLASMALKQSGRRTGPPKR